MTFLKASSSVKAYQIIKTFLFFSFWRMEEVSVIQHSYWVYNLLPLLIFEERFIASCGNTEYSKGTHWLLDPCLPSIFIKTLLSFLPKSDCCWLLPALSYLEHYMIPDYFVLCSCSVCPVKAAASSPCPTSILTYMKKNLWASMTVWWSQLWNHLMSHLPDVTSVMVLGTSSLSGLCRQILRDDFSISQRREHGMFVLLCYQSGFSWLEVLDPVQLLVTVMCCLWRQAVQCWQPRDSFHLPFGTFPAAIGQGTISC